MTKIQNGSKGDCFEATLKYLMERDINDIKKIALVHGNVSQLSQNKEINHAWVEEGDMIHDVANGKHFFVEKKSYYKKMGVKNIRRYSLMDALLENCKSEHWGPW